MEFPPEIAAEEGNPLIGSAELLLKTPQSAAKSADAASVDSDAAASGERGGPPFEALLAQSAAAEDGKSEFADPAVIAAAEAEAPIRPIVASAPAASASEPTTGAFGGVEPPETSLSAAIASPEGAPPTPSPQVDVVDAPPRPAQAQNEADETTSQATVKAIRPEETARPAAYEIPKTGEAASTAVDEAPIVPSLERTTEASPISPAQAATAPKPEGAPTAPPPVRSEIVARPDRNRIMVEIRAADANARTEARQERVSFEAAVRGGAMKTATSIAAATAASSVAPGVASEVKSASAGAFVRPDAKAASELLGGEKAQLDPALGAGKGEAASAARASAMPAPTAIQAGQAASVAAQVVSKIGAAAASPGADRIEIQLDPPELGRLVVTYSLSDDRLVAVIAAERADTSELLRRHAELLTRDLNRIGFADVDLSFGASGGGGFENREDAESSTPEVGAAESASAPVRAAPGVSGNGRLDIRL